MAVLLYPRAKWLFALALIGVAGLIWSGLAAKDPTSQDLADRMERLLTGKYAGWDIYDFEHLRIRDPDCVAFGAKT